MINAGLAEQNQWSAETPRLTRATVLKVFAIIAIVSFVLRIFYAGHLYEDDGLWFAAAEEIVRGKALYREIYFDKPPALPLLYAGLFWLFGAHIIVIRLFTIAYALSISAMLYLFGAHLYDKRTGLLAAAMFAFFSTTSASGHVQGLNTDFLMVLPYTAGAYFLVRSKTDSRIWFALAGGVIIGVAIQVNPKGVFDLIFFGLFVVVYPKLKDEITSRNSLLLAAALVGLALGSVPFLAYIAATQSLSYYWIYVWRWGASYAGYYPLWWSVSQGSLRSLNFFALNNTLLIALIVVLADTTKRVRRSGVFWPNVSRFLGGSKARSGPDFWEEHIFRSDITLLLWLLVSYTAVVLGGRFFSHYFFQILPALCLLGARGLFGMASTTVRGRSEVARRALIALFAVGFAVTVVRFHTRTVTLAVDWVRGTKSGLNAQWYHELRNNEAQMVAAAIRELPHGENATEGVVGEAAAPSDYLFVWGYAPGIYYRSGLLPASRYLSIQPLTGVPADVQYINGEHRSILDETSTAEARQQLLRDLNETQPKYIVDEVGMYNLALTINTYPELAEFMKNYKATGAVSRFMVYCRRDLLPKKLRRMREEGQ
jgi:4-amino-4-deoxy-L-arabinose transferase-like glycosyltransferase